VVLQWCCSGVAVVLQWCCSGVAVVLQWRCSGATIVFGMEEAISNRRKPCSGVTVVFQSVVSPWILQWCYSGGVTVVLQWCYSGVTVVLQPTALCPLLLHCYCGTFWLLSCSCTLYESRQHACVSE
jgi:hypothetical protein